jgi:Domian of unknown function (DUF4952)
MKDAFPIIKLLTLAIMVFFVSGLASPGYANGNSAAREVNKEKKCSDFLLELRKKPSRLEFVSCESKKIAQLRALRSTYRVEGKHARDIEKYFMKTAALPVLKRSCCLWEPKPSHAGDVPNGALKKGKDVYLIRMVSADNDVSQRSRWSEIDYFYVTVDFFLEEP